MPLSLPYGRCGRYGDPVAADHIVVAEGFGFFIVALIDVARTRIERFGPFWGGAPKPPPPPWPPPHWEPPGP
jgi:hypothetical protein